MKTNIILWSLGLLMTFLLNSCAKKNTASFTYVNNGAYHSFEDQQEEVLTPQNEAVQTEPLGKLESPTQAVEQLEPTVSKEQNQPRSQATQQKKEVKQLLKELSRKEKKEIKKQLKAQLKEMKSDKVAETSSDIDPVILAILSIIFPLAPVMMYIFEGDLTDRVWISLILTILFWLPGVIYNFIIMLM